MSLFEPKAASALAKFTWILVGGPMDDIDLDALPDADQYRDLVASQVPGGSFMGGFWHWESAIWAALAYERLGMAEHAMAFAEKTLADDHVGAMQVPMRSHACACRGRILAASGRTADALAAFEDAVLAAQSREYVWLEVCALQDMVDRFEGTPAQRKERLSRLDAAFERLAASRKQAEDLLCRRFIGWAPHCPMLPVTEASAAETALRAELAELRTGEMRRRAVSVGIDQTQIDAADDEDDPKAAMMDLFLTATSLNLEAVGDAQTLERDAAVEALRAELSALKLGALRKRARGAEVSEDALDEAGDEDNVRAAIIELNVQATQLEMETGDGAAVQALREELSALKVGALRKRARAATVSADAIDDANDADDAAASLIDLIIQAEIIAEPASFNAGGMQQAAVTGAATADPSGSDGGGEDARLLRQELQQMKVMALHRRAAAEGVPTGALEDAMESDQPKQELVALLIKQVGATAANRFEEQQELRQELGELRLMALHKRASGTELGLQTEQVDDAMESDDPKRALVELLVAAECSATRPKNVDSQRPHFGAETSSHSAPVVDDGRHVMLSYQWDHQRSVMRVQEHLSRLGVKCWMDISGGMGSDIYDSMAQGVSSASVVVCFMSQKYQDSANCTLEAKFAKQSGIEIIPVIMEGGGWQASGWLGLLTAGALWVPLHEEADFEQNVRQLHTQLLKTIGSSAAFAAEDGDTVAAVASSTEAIEELERLREEQAASSSQSTVSAALADPSQPANIPAGVPKLPVRFQATEQIRELTRLVLSGSRSDMAMPRVGFYGMGGIGKTVTGAAIVRDDGVRRHFDAIVWLPIGQTPVVAKLQNLCHMQCTGKELSAELSSEEKKQALQQAMAGKKVLLCLDDIWEEAAETELNFADVCG
eukprot:SAG22_NODE_218_length_14885_cov_24.733699_3_plen_893_part_00